MSFASPFRQQEKRTLKGNLMVGVVVDTDDPERQQRIKVRSHYIHRGIKDEDLPWVSPSALTSSNSGGGTGSHGPIPNKGSKVWFQFNDDSQYSGSYMGGVNTQDTKIEDFTKKGTKWGDSYPHATGGIDASGNFSATDTKTDRREETHVSGTGMSTDGKGNQVWNINGDADTGNKDAKKDHPKGGTINVQGGMTIKASGDKVLSCKGKFQLMAGTTLKISAGQTIIISAGQAIQLCAPSITSSVPIVVGANVTPDAPVEPDAITTRKRPEVKSKANDTEY